jgi:hypothetical protein
MMHILNAKDHAEGVQVKKPDHMEKQFKQEGYAQYDRYHGDCHRLDWNSIRRVLDATEKKAGAPAFAEGQQQDCGDAADGGQREKEFAQPPQRYSVALDLLESLYILHLHQGILRSPFRALNS